jgi:hypothetical protein
VARPTPRHYEDLPWHSSERPEASESLHPLGRVRRNVPSRRFMGRGVPLGHSRGEWCITNAFTFSTSFSRGFACNWTNSWIKTAWTDIVLRKMSFWKSTM